MKTLTITIAAISIFAVLLAPLVQVQAARQNFTAVLSGAQEVPTRDTEARGLAKFQISTDGSTIRFRLAVANIQNVIMAHIHLAPEGVNGPVVVFLYGPVDPAAGRAHGILSHGTITASDLTGPLEGRPLSELLDAMTSGNAYVNVHTNDGIGPANTGPGDFPGGEIRGQIQPAS